MSARKSWLSLFTVFVVLVGVVALVWWFTIREPTPGLPATEPMKHLTIAQAGDFFLYAPLYVAIDAGFFHRQGLEVRLVSTGGDEKTWAAVVSGDAAFGVADPTFVAVSASRGQPGQVVASIVNGVPFWGISFDNEIAQVRSAADLEGLTVGTFPAPSTAYTLQRRMFEEEGLQPRIREGAFGTMIAMLKAGQADVALELEPNVSQAVGEGAHIVYSLADRYGDFAITGLTATPELIENEPDLVEKVTCALQLALDDIHDHPDESLELLAARFPEIKPAVAKAALARVIDTGIIPHTVVLDPSAWRKAIELRQEVGDLDQDAPYQRFVYSVAARSAVSGCRLRETH